MENKDIILIILIILVLYLLVCDNRKNKKIQKLEEQFTSTSGSTSGTTSVEWEKCNDVNCNITESIKNLGILAKKIQEGGLTLPGDITITGKLKVNNIEPYEGDTININSKTKIGGDLNMNGTLNMNGNIEMNNKQIRKVHILQTNNIYSHSDSNNINIKYGTLNFSEAGIRMNKNNIDDVQKLKVNESIHFGENKTFIDADNIEVRYIVPIVKENKINEMDRSVNKYKIVPMIRNDNIGFAYAENNNLRLDWLVKNEFSY